MIKLCIVIPTYNRKDYLKTILRQLHEQENHGADLFFVVVVDGSTDGTLEMLAKDFPDVHVVHGNGNWWYTKSMNEGFKYAKRFDPDYFLTMNDDTEVENDFLKNILAARDIENNSIVGAISLTKDNPPRVFFAGVKPKEHLLQKNRPYIPQFDYAENCKLTGLYPSVSLPGRGMLIPEKILLELNGFDEKFPQYDSDDDFCLRASKKGYKVYVSWDAQIFCYHMLTGKGTCFLQESFFDFMKSYFDFQSRTYIKKTFLITFRHRNIFIAPIIFLKALLAPIKYRYFHKTY